ncbi:hydrogenase expression/formation protein HypE (plasmid) [Rhizobium sp. T1470]|uniref:hydrogenase expression/formation protein HypE n=1 Tax=unclassified Rhizobium TaxID=2613769 RepID=UPI001AAE2CF6|nr:hydrogenase expression/formation protein HypE [Rhizobium sp. T1473]MCA0806447.1 hydrogenase expression/formation protein HypE [Rhizobium sp. T1473]
MNAPALGPLVSRAVDMTHGAGGRASVQLIQSVFLKYFANPFLDQGNDGADIGEVAGRLVVTTDGHVVSPLFFPGGDIGSLSVHGTVNDLAVMGARPVCLTAAFIIEEGFPIEALEAIASSMGRAARDIGVPIVTGDTKVVGRGQGDGVFITLTGLGCVAEGVRLSGNQAKPGDCILVSGTIGDHGIAIMSKRENLEFETEILSDSQPLHDLAAAMLEAVPGIRAMRDPTRGGLSATLNEIAHQSGVGMSLIERDIPVRPEVHAACELLGIDPLNVANEGKLIAICAPEDSQNLLAVMRDHPRGRAAALIGTVIEDANCLIRMKTGFGGSRVVDWIAGEQLPRIC